VIEDLKHSTADLPAWSGIADSAWNYGLCTDKPESFIFKSADSISANPWANPAYEIMVPVKRIKGWKIIKQDTITNAHWTKVIENGKKPTWIIKNTLDKGDYSFTPKFPDRAYLKKNMEDKIDTVSLVPYGCTRLRITIFPDLEVIQ